MAPTLETDTLLVTPTPSTKIDLKNDPLVKVVPEEQWPEMNAMPQDKRSVEVIRGLVLDCCQQHGIGHGGSALGMAGIATVLWRHVLRIDPAEPGWFDRDRFVLSNGHVAILQYIMLHLSGYEDWTMEQLLGYCHPTALDFTNMSKTHPEIEFPGLDMSTGPLGQGIANAVGMAMANMNMRNTFNKDGFEIVKGKVYCTSGDACLQEGVALEAISLAGHLKLENLILIYDNNGVQCDGPITLTFDEDVNTKMRSCGWYTIDVHDGSSNVNALRTALNHANAHTGHPVFINIRTVIGFGTSIAGTSKAHHAAFGLENVAKCKKLWNLDVEKTHQIPQETKDYWSEVPRKGARAVHAWHKLLDKYAIEYPKLCEEYCNRAAGRFNVNWKQSLLEYRVPTSDVPIRQASADIYDHLWDTIPFFAGSADLSEPNFTLRKAKGAFGPPSLDNPKASFQGRYVHYGTREHGMIAMANGIAAYAERAFVPVTATFAMFQLYGGSALRMTALSKLQVIHIGTHDSISEGACGPTHQPVELLSLFRAIPDLNHIRPGDAEEAVGAWLMALDFKGPTILGLNRHGVPLQAGTSRIKMQRGAYTIHEDPDYKLTFVSTGGDLFRAVKAAKLFTDAGIPTRVVSMPSMRTFEQQTAAYQLSIFPVDGRPVISYEAMSTHGWAKYATASIGHNDFGTTVDAKEVYPHFKLTEEDVFDRVTAYLAALGDRNPHLVPWRNI